MCHLFKGCKSSQKVSLQVSLRNSVPSGQIGVCVFGFVTGQCLAGDANEQHFLAGAGRSVINACKAKNLGRRDVLQKVDRFLRIHDRALANLKGVPGPSGGVRAADLKSFQRVFCF